MPVLRELGVGHTVWQLIIGRDQFNAASGLVYPDGTVRRIAQVEAVMNAPATGFEEKPDEQGLPHSTRHSRAAGPVLGGMCTRRRDGGDLARAGDACRVAGRSARAAFRKCRPHATRVASPRRDSPMTRAIVRGGFRPRGRADRESGLLPCEQPAEPAPPSVVKATVYRDVYGVPHIFADSEEAAAYAIAQAQCEDIGMQVFDSLRCGVGRQAEVLGEAELESDRTDALVASAGDRRADVAREPAAHEAVPAGFLRRT